MPTDFHSKVTVDRKVPIPMRDRINLTADIYRPKGIDTPLPVLLMRLPYGRSIASTVTYAHPSWYAQQGYIVVIQDVRGCGTSEGEFYPFRHEYEDGYDTVRWCVESLAGSNGKVGMYGFSYQGATQFQAAVMQPAGLVTICPAMTSADFYDGWFYFGGSIALDFTLGWALQLSQNRAQFLRLEPQATQLFQAQQNLSHWLNANPLDQIQILKQEPLGQFFFDWIGHPLASDPYWQELNPVSRFANYDLPALHIAGWADLFITASLQTYAQAKLHTQKPQHLVIGPWQHLPWRSKVGELDFGSTATPKIDRLQIDWFDYWLKGIDNGISDRSTVQIFLMGANHWLDLSGLDRKLDRTDSHTLYLHENGQLKSQKPDLESSPDIYVYDPRNPNPSTAYGQYDQRVGHQRWDVLLYFSDVLLTDLSILGTAEFLLYAATSAPDTDWVVKLLDVYPDGRQMSISIGVLRARYHKSLTEPDFVEPDRIYEYQIEFRPTGHCFLAGHQIGIAIASSAFPLIERHSNTMQIPCTVSISDFVEATQQIHHSDRFPSHLRLPLLHDILE